MLPWERFDNRVVEERPRCLRNGRHGYGLVLALHSAMRLVRFAAAIFVTFAATQVTGCTSTTPDGSKSDSTVVEEKLQQAGVDKIDVLLMIDNSPSMGDKQQVLAAALPHLIDRLVHPRCVDSNMVPVANQPPIGQACPSGTSLEFPAVKDIHIGVVTSSLGGHGSDACREVPGTNDDDDHGELVSRAAPTSANGSLPTYESKGFLAWDPDQQLTPPGVGDEKTLVSDIAALVAGVGDVGCGFGSQLESWYRFLVDPNPYQSITVDPTTNIATPVGTDQVLLRERANFLRPDSLLAIIGLSGENDCSTKEYGQYYLLNQLEADNQQPYHLPPARTPCATNPNDACCFSCGQPDMKSCTPAKQDPACFQGGSPVELDDSSDALNLRCWETKRRFGVEFLYPTDRYVQALTQPSITDNQGNVVPNPIFSRLDPTNTAPVRDPSLVFFAQIVGVPWQDIARDPHDLSRGFKNATELAAPDPALGGKSAWDVVLGDPANYYSEAKAFPLDPLMLERDAPRTGENPVLGAPLVECPAEPGDAEGNPINGCEWSVPAKDDLEYACIFKLAKPRDCTLAANSSDCDCSATDAGDKPLCDATTNTLQRYAKAYPGIRELSVVKGVNTQGIAASICPSQLSDQAAMDYGYDATVESIVDRLKVALGGKCLPVQLAPNASGDVPCIVLEARNTGAKCADPTTCCGQCSKTPARQQVSSEHVPAVEEALQDPSAATAGWDCFCEIPQAGGGSNDSSSDLFACQNDVDDPAVNAATKTNVSGWCYVDATTEPPTGNAELVSKCPANDQRLLRFSGDANPAPGATLFITCESDSEGSNM